MFFKFLLLMAILKKSQLSQIKMYLNKVFKVPMKYYCVKGIVYNFGFKGLRFAKKRKLEMCPNVKYSCCSRKDQI